MKRNILTKLAIIVLIAFNFSIVEASGTVINAKAEEVIQITTPDDLQKLQNCEKGDVVELINDIDMISYGYWESIDFHGTFNGNGHTINNLSSNTGGLFNNIDQGASVNDLRITNVAINVSGNSGTIGGIANTNGGTINRCYVSGSIKYVYERNRTDSNIIVGGIAGSNDSSSCINECINNASILGYANTNISDSSFYSKTYVGGIVGELCEGASILNCLNNTEDIEGADMNGVDGHYVSQASKIIAGGIAGYVDGKIGDCISASPIMGACSILSSFFPYVDNILYTGDLVGYVDENGYIYYSFAPASYQSIIGYASTNFDSVKGISDSDISSYEGMDTSLWTMNKNINNEIPLLIWYKEYYQLPKPISYVKSGTYNHSIKVDLSSDISGAKIYYTIDGSTPTNQSKQYKGAIIIKKSTAIKAIVYFEDYKISKVATFKYNIIK